MHYFIADKIYSGSKLLPPKKVYLPVVWREPNWDGCTDGQKDKAVAEELRLETHNGTTKDDLLNIIRYLAAKVKEAAR